MSKIIPKKVNKRDRLDLIISTLTAPLLFIIIFSSIVLIAVAQIDGVEEYTTDTEYAPDAEFSADVIWGYAPLTVKFTDESTGNPTEWKWNFGDGSPIIDGTTSDYQNPTHTYEKAGVYEVKETAINSVGRNTEIKTEYITVKSSKDIENTDYSGSQISDEKYFTRDSQDESDTETDVPPQTQIIETITQFYTTHVEDISTTFIDDKDTNTIYNNPSSDPSNGDSIVNNIITVIGSIISAVIVAYIQTKRK